MILGFILCFAPVALAGSLILRWFQLSFLYNNMEKYWSDIGVTLGVTILILIIACLIAIKLLLPFNRITKKIKYEDYSPTEEDKHQCLKIHNRINRLMIIVYFIVFFVGQAAVSIIEVIVGLTPFNLVNILMCIFQATCLGGLFALISLYSFSGFITKYKALLKIQDMNVFGKHKWLNVSAAIKAIFFFSVGFLLANLATVPIGIINSQNVPSIPIFLKRFGFAAGVSLICIILPISIYLQGLKSRLVDTSHRIKDIAEKGDLSNRMNISTIDDFGSIIGSVNELINKLSSIVTNLKDGTGVVSSSASALTDVSQSAVNALEEMKTAFSNIDTNVKSQNQYIVKANETVDNLTNDVENVKHHVQEQSAAIQQTSASVSEMTANIASVADLTQKADDVSHKLAEASVIGNESIKNAKISIEDIQSASKEVESIIRVIQEISSQTNMLAMNAAIEAAHAGEVGKGFAVVADEVRSLASSSGKSAKDIQLHIKDMIEKINIGAEAMDKASGAFNEISNHVETNVELTKTIAAAMEEQKTSAEETLRTTSEIVDAIQAIQQLTENENHIALELRNAMKNVIDSSKQAEEVVQASADSSAALQNALEKVSSSIKDNENAVTTMKVDIDSFVI